MALTTKNLNCNLITAELDLRSAGEAHGEWDMAKFKYGDLDYFPKRYWYMEE